MQKKSSIIFIISYVVFAAVGIFIIYDNLSLVRSKQYWMYYDFSVSKYVLFFVALILSLVLFILMRRIDLRGVRIKRFAFKLFVLAVIIFIIQLLVADNIFFYIDWDVKYLREAAGQYISGLVDEFHTNYFKVNPNNVCMWAITIAFMKIGTFLSVDGYMLLVYFGVLLNTLTIVITSLCVRRLTNNDVKAVLSIAVSLLFFGLSPWIIAPYTDTYSLIIPILSFYIFICMRESKKHWAIKTITTVLLPAIAYMIKPTNIFVLIAIAIYEIVILIREPDKRRTLLKLCVGAVIVIALMFISKSIVYKAVNYTEDESVKKPIAHYMMLGSNEGMVGMYSSPDDEYTNSLDGIDAKVKGDIDVIINRYTNMGISGYIKHLLRKTYLNYANGIFGWGKEQYFVDSIEKSSDALGQFLQDIYYVGGDNLLINENSFGTGGRYFSYYASFEQIVWYMILILSVVRSLNNIIIEQKYNRYISIDRTKAVLAITLIGMFVFLSVFETNARYLYSLLPLYVVYDLTKELRGDKSAQLFRIKR